MPVVSLLPPHLQQLYPATTPTYTHPQHHQTSTYNQGMQYTSQQQVQSIPQQHLAQLQTQNHIYQQQSQLLLPVQHVQVAPGHYEQNHQGIGAYDQFTGTHSSQKSPQPQVSDSFSAASSSVFFDGTSTDSTGIFPPHHNQHAAIITPIQ
jgi:hypothetical protein